MSETAERIAPYLPPLLQRWLTDAPEQRWREAQGSVVFVDVSGFTRLSERLARVGRAGAEVLTEAIGACFAQLLAVAYAEGGTLLKFGGDALLLLFVDEGHERRASGAAAGMRAALRRMGSVATPAGPVRLRMSAAVHTGRFRLFLVGASHRELVLAGSAFSEVVRLEGVARPGEILLSGATAAALGSTPLLRPHPAGFLLRRAPARAGVLGDVLPAPAVEEAVLGLPPVLRAHVLAGRRDGEHRRVTVAFVRFEGTDRHLAAHGPEATAAALDRLVTGVQRAVDAHDLTFLGSDVDRDGGKLILAAGTPVSHGDDEERMLHALQDVARARFDLPVRVGVNQGHVFAGDVGPAYRRTYTVMGDAVNVAARLMAAAAPGEILAASAVTAASRTQFRVTALPPLQVKGRRRPVEAHRVGTPVGRRAVGTSLPLVGRRDELDELAGWLRPASGGQGRVVEVVAEPGMGKSRLVEELRATWPGDRRVAVACEAHRSATPYAAAGDLLAQVLGTEDRAEGPAALRAAAAARAPELLPWIPLLAPVLGEELAASAETAQLDPAFLRQRLHRTAADLLAAVLDTPTLLTVEDAHWMDEASAELVGFLLQGVAARPWAVCVTRREGDGGFVTPAGPSTHVLALRPLPAATAEQLVHAVTERAPLPGHVVAGIVARAGGNPMYAAELAAAAADADGVEELPDTLETLLTARIDRLPPDDRAVLRRLAVLGGSFDPALAGELLGPDAEATLSRLDAFLEVGERSVAFRHALVWESAYEALPYRLRQELHDDVAAALERAAGDDPDELAEALSFQCLHAHRFAEAWRYALIAARRAARIDANAAAALFYERALTAGAAMEGLPREELAAAFEALGDVRERMGGFADAAAAYRAARHLCAGRPVDEARLLLKYAWEQGRLRRYSQALRWISSGLRLLHGRADPAAEAQRAQLLVWYARFLQEQGRHREAIPWCLRAVPVAEEAGERAALALAYTALDRAFMYLGEPERAVHAPQALALYQELGDLAGQGWTLNSMGAFAYWQGRWSEALELYHRAHDIWVRTGNEDGVAFAKANTAEILSDQGRLADAERLLLDALRMWEAAGHRSHVAMAKSDLARVATRAGRHEEAARRFAEARAELDDVGARADALETEVRVAESLLLRGEAARALEVSGRLLAEGDEDGDSAAQPSLLRVRGHALLQLGDLPGARRALEASLRAARRRGAAYEVALTLRGLARLAERDGLEDTQVADAESEAILRRLDVVALPDIPLAAAPAADDRAPPLTRCGGPLRAAGR